MKFINKIKEIILNAFYPQHIKCISCNCELKNQNIYDMCDKCLHDLHFITNNFCIRCGQKLPNDLNGTCLTCSKINYNFDFARSSVEFKDCIVNIIHKFKYSKCKFLAQPLSYLLYDTLKLQNWKIDVICYVPLFLKREKFRGYNQARELAIYLSQYTNIPIFHDIVRLKDTPTQTTLSRKERYDNVKDCFKVNNKSAIKNLNVLLIDDVFTSGSTVNEVSKELKKAGVNKIYVLTVAHAEFKQQI